MIKNINEIKFVFAPINVGKAESGHITDDLAEFYIERSGKGIDLTYIGNIAIKKKVSTNDNTVVFYNEDKNKWIELTRRINSNGSLVGAQLACRLYPFKAQTEMKNSDKQKKVSEIQKFILDLEFEEINSIVDDFILSALYAHETGFDVVQIHAAHGYFLSLLLSPYLNLRSDIYDSKNIFALSSIINGIRDKLGNEIIIDLRISLFEGIEDKDTEYNDKITLLKKICALDIDMISISNGIYDLDKTLIYPNINDGFGVYIDHAKHLAELFSHNHWNVSGNINNLSALANSNLPDNLSFSIGRPLIADPNFIDLSLNGNVDLISRCDFKGTCHYYSSGREKISCPSYSRKYKKNL